MATATKTRVTAEEFFKMDLGEGRFELVRGEIIALTPPEYAHGYVCANFTAALHDFGRRTGHGHVASNDAAVAIDDETVRGGDVCYYSEARWPRAQVGKGRPPVVPDLVVEVYSPSDRPGKLQEKLAEYLEAGVPMVWVAYPKHRRLAIYRGDDPPIVLSESDFVENLPELPGFRCQIAEFFA
jgi:Uma2 family endonuclease